MKLYHGTNVDFDFIDFNKTQKYKDTGLYTQSPAYIYELLKQEYQTGVLA